MVEIVNLYDPLVSKRSEQDRAYELGLIKNSLKYLREVDDELYEKISGFMEEERNSKSFALIIRKFI